MAGKLLGQSLTAGILCNINESSSKHGSLIIPLSKHQGKARVSDQ